MNKREIERYRTAVDYWLRMAGRAESRGDTLGASRMRRNANECAVHLETLEQGS